VNRLVAEAPTPGPVRPWSFPSWQRHRVDGGTVLAAHLPGQQLAAVALVVDAGATTEPTGQEGVALLTARLLGEGTQVRDAFEFGVAVERLGASWHADVDWDSLRVGFDAPVTALPDAVDLLAEAVRRPAFSPTDVERVRDDRLDELRAELLQPAARASATFNAHTFAAPSRYGRPDGGDPESVAAVTDDDVRAFHAARFAPGAATLVVAGDLSRVDAADLGRRMFSGWTAGVAPVASPVVTPLDGGRRIVVVDRPGSVQSVLVIGHPGPPRAIEDYVPTTTMAIALGGMFSARLNMKLREERGFTYGASAGFGMRRHGGIFAARASVHAEPTAQAVADTVAEIERLQRDGIDADELDQVRRYRAGVFPIQFASPYAVAGALGDLTVHGLPDDYFDRVRHQIAEVPLDAVNEAARRRLHPDRLLTVVVGDASVVADGLREIGAGAVEVVSD
jgi:predicted Zn-dependent peptidase